MAKQKRNRNWIQEHFFLIIPKPQKDELLSSWLTRMALVHRRTLTVFLSLFVKHEGSSLSRRDIDFMFDDKLFDTIAAKSGLDKKEILNMSLRSEEGYLYRCNDCLYPPNQIRKLVDKRSHFGLMFCPRCLVEDKIPYFRKKWRYAFYNACPKHMVFLTDRCWSCYERIKLTKIKYFDEIIYCSKCSRDLRLTTSLKVLSSHHYGIKAIQWFEKGLERGYFLINNQKINSVFIFESCIRLQHLLDRREKLILDGFPMLDDYKKLCEREQNYHSKKSLSAHKNFYLTSMAYYLFQNYPNNLKKFAENNKLTYRDFMHGFKNLPFWYIKTIEAIVPMQNKTGREISESEVVGAIKYLQSIGEKVTQESVAAIVGCHFTVHKGFVRLYKNITIFPKLMLIIVFLFKKVCQTMDLLY